MKPIIIGIAGGSASGKTSIAKIVYDAFDDQKSVVIIRQDDYYKDQSHLTMEERVLTNYDHPFAFDNDLFINIIPMKIIDLHNFEVYEVFLRYRHHHSLPCKRQHSFYNEHICTHCLHHFQDTIYFQYLNGSLDFLSYLKCLILYSLQLLDYIIYI